MDEIHERIVSALLDIPKQKLDDYGLELVATCHYEGAGVNELYETKWRLERYIKALEKAIDEQRSKE